MDNVKWQKGDRRHWAMAGGFRLAAYLDGRWSMYRHEDGAVCGCMFDCGRCHQGTAKSRKKARKAAEAKWLQVVAAEKAAQVKPEPEPVPVDAPTRPTVEIVRPERAVLRRRGLAPGDLYRQTRGCAAVSVASEKGAHKDGCIFTESGDLPPKVDPCTPVVRVNLRCEDGRVVGYEDVPESKGVALGSLPVGSYCVIGGSVWKVGVPTRGDITSETMVEPCTIERIPGRIVATVTT